MFGAVTKNGHCLPPQLHFKVLPRHHIGSPCTRVSEVSVLVLPSCTRCKELSDIISIFENMSHVLWIDLTVDVNKNVERFLPLGVGHLILFVGVPQQQ